MIAFRALGVAALAIVLAACRGDENSAAFRPLDLGRALRSAFHACAGYHRPDIHQDRAWRPLTVRTI